MTRTPLRYPGGKSRALPTILPLVPDFGEYREPFLGGGSVFLALKKRFPNRNYTVNDLHVDLFDFWDVLKSDDEKLIHSVFDLKRRFTDGRELFDFLKSQPPGDRIDRAARFYVLNRISFSGLAETGGYSNAAFEGRFLEHHISRLREVSTELRDVSISNSDYSELLARDGSDVFLFLDPPYFSARGSRLYGPGGKLHTDFDHEKFVGEVLNTEHKWMITYDNDPRIREMFEGRPGLTLIQWELHYPMTNSSGKDRPLGRELMVVNFQLPEVLRA